MNTHLINNTLALLRQVERHATTSEQFDALKASRTLLYFILGRGEAGEFKDYFERFDTAPVRPLLSFATREEADTWLRNHPAAPHGATIRAAKDLYTVVDARALNHRKLLRQLSLEELGLTDEEVGQEPADESEPPKPNPGERFSLFGLYERTCYDLYQMEKHVTSPEELESIRIAKISFHFVMHEGEEYGFEDYLESIRSARSAPPRKSFTTRAEADTWLATQPEPPPPVVVAIGNELYAAGYNRRRGLRLLIRHPTPPELNTGAP
ncbi:hypothetical protein ACN28E_01900 [Archangium lansingense]|uniref:hypothetical protein n=1 Tax=Archangium lansingense TaxID=2995310 RepID=UPI003B7C25F1